MLKKGFILFGLTLVTLTACSQERPSTFKTEAQGEKSEQIDSEGASDVQPLMDAIMNGEIDKVKELATEQNVNQRDDLSNTPLMVAVQYMDLEIVNVLLEKGADPTITDDLGVDSIMMAEDSENLELTNLLKSYTSK
jgi:ankyrin repeat protein